MSKALGKFTDPGETKNFRRKTVVLAREHRNLSKLKTINTTGLSYPFNAAANVNIDKQIEGPCGNLPTEELDGIHAYDPTNELSFIRINNNWKKLKLE